MKYLTLITSLSLLFAFQLQVSQAQGWFWQNPLPQGHGLSSVVFINETTGCAVGGYGTILRTDDGGTTWIIQTSGTTRNLHGVSLSDADHGTAVGEGGTILRTNDGGATWTAQTSGTEIWLSGVSFSDMDHGTAVGDSGTILRTTDGGTTWTAQTSGTIEYLEDVCFSDADHGTAVGWFGTILRTTDGGATWTKQNIGGTSQMLCGVSFIDTDHGTVVGRGGTILKTTNGGTTWTAKNSGTSQMLLGVSFSDADHGTIVGGMGTILRTEDGGTTWTMQTSGTIYGVLSVSFSDADHGTAVGEGGIILRTTDGGATWTAQSSGTINSLHGVSFSDADHGTAVGGIGTILRTTDGGTTWTEQNSGINNSLNGISFSDTEHGTAVGVWGTILRTTDCGTFWTEQNSGTIANLRAVSFSDADHGTAVGEGGTILRTTDGGTTWTEQNSGTTSYLLDVSFSDNEHGTAVGDGATIMRTNDGGATWIEQTCGTPACFYGVSFSDADHGTVVGSEGTILRTNNGGATWTEQNSGITEWLYGVSFSDTDHGTIVGAHGTILRTDDAGTTWTKQNSGTFNTLNDVSFGNPYHGTAVGDGGTILRTNDGGGVTFIIKVPDDLPTIQAGIDSAHDGNIVLVDEDTYYENINFRGKAITVASHYLMDGDTSHISNTIINGSQPNHPDSGSVVSFVSGEDTTSILCGFTITSGTGTLYDSETRVGGGIYCENAGARIMYNKIIHNSVTHDHCYGGGIGSWPAENVQHIIIEDNLIESNSLSAVNGANGGGIFLVQGRITGNKINGNLSHGESGFATGGGISANCGEIANRTLVKVFNNEITNNQAITDQYIYSGYGGGVDVIWCDIELEDNTITHNLVNGPEFLMGAGVRIWGPKDICLVKDNTISFNSFTSTPNGQCYGGGMNVAHGGDVIIQGNRFEGNEGTYGGGLATGHHISCVVSDNEFIANTAEWGGGVSEGDNVQITMNQNLFRQNTALYSGGGLISAGSDIQFTNNVLAKNEAQRGGGTAFEHRVEYLMPLNAQAINNTFTENIADSAGGIVIWDSTVTLTAINNICWGNDAPFAPEILVQGGELNVAFSNIQYGIDSLEIIDDGILNWLPGNINEDPLFRDSENADFCLTRYSPCVGRGIDSIEISGIWYYCPTTDYNGDPRPNPVDVWVDMGALESSFEWVPEGRDYKLIDVNSISAWVSNRGSIFRHPLTGNSGFQWPKGDTTYAIYAAGIWIGARPFIDGEIRSPRVAVAEYSYEFQPGKIIDGAPDNPDLARYQVYKWSVGETPDEEAVADGAPETFLGDQFLWSVYNEADASYHINMGTGPLGIEVQQSVFGFEQADPLDDIIFVKWLVINKSGYELRNTYITVWCDPDLGDSGDDFVGCDTMLSLGFCYNSSNLDGEYGEAPPSVGIDFLQGPIIPSPGDTAYVSGQRFTDYRNLPLTSFVYYNNSNENNGNPQTGAEVYNYMQGRWRDGTPITYGETGLNPDNPPTNFMFIGDPETGEGWLDSGPADRRFMMTTGPFSLISWVDENENGKEDIGEPGVQEIVAGVLITKGTNNLNSVTLLKENDIILQEFYDEIMCVKIEDYSKYNQLQYNLSQNYPNPFNPVTIIEFSLPKTSNVILKIYNILGEEVVTLVSDRFNAGSYTYEWDASGFASGIYLYRLETEGYVETKKMVLMK